MLYTLNLSNVICQLYLYKSGKKEEGILVSRGTLRVGHTKGPEEWPELVLTAMKKGWTRPGKVKVMEIRVWLRIVGYPRGKVT